jgi:hypothetical protein
LSGTPFKNSYVEESERNPTIRTQEYREPVGISHVA